MRHGLIALIVSVPLVVTGCGAPNYRNSYGSGEDMSVDSTSDDLGGGGTALTGAPCQSDGDCAPGTKSKGSCILTLGTGDNAVAWPMGYCTNVCSVAANDQNTGVNAACPGNGTCTSDDTGDAGHCRAICMTSRNCRSNYSCFWENDQTLGCEPHDYSDCDPRIAGSCTSYDDGGENMTCQDAGDGTVGTCVPRCDPFTVTGCPGGMDYSDCHVSYLTGEGYCDAPNTMSAPAGTDCGSDTDCAAGYGCLAGQCWKYCREDGTSLYKQCGVYSATCKPLEMSTVKTSIVGICSKSN